MSENEQIAALMRLVDELVAATYFNDGSENLLLHRTAIEAHARKLVEGERERCAALCDDLAALMENGAGDPVPGGRLRQAARYIRTGEQPMCLATTPQPAPAPQEVPTDETFETAFQLIFAAYSRPSDSFGTNTDWAIWQHGKVIDAFSLLQKVRAARRSPAPQADQRAVMQQALDAILFLAKVANVSHSECDSVGKAIAALRQALAAKEQS